MELIAVNQEPEMTEVFTNQGTVIVTDKKSVEEALEYYNEEYIPPNSHREQEEDCWETTIILIAKTPETRIIRYTINTHYKSPEMRVITAMLHAAKTHRLGSTHFPNRQKTTTTLEKALRKLHLLGKKPVVCMTTDQE